MENKNLFIISICVLLLFAFLMCIPNVSASTIHENLPAEFYDYPTQNYNSDYYLNVYSSNRYVVFHFESEPVNSYIFNTNGYYLFYSPVNYDVFEYTNGTWTHLYNIQASSYNIGGKTIDYLYSSFDVYHQDGTLLYKGQSKDVVAQLINGTSNNFFKILKDVFSFFIDNPIVSISIVLPWVLTIIFFAIVRL